MLSLNNMAQHYASIVKPLVNENTVLLSLNKMNTSPEDVLQNPTKYHINNVSLLIKELKETKPKVLDEDTLVLYIAYKLMVQHILIGYDHEKVFTLKEVLLQGIKVSGDSIDCLLENDFIATMQIGVTIDAVKFNEFYAHYVKQCSYSQSFFRKCLSDALVLMKYSPECIVTTDEDIISTTLRDLISNVYSNKYEISDQRAFTFYVLWRLYDEKGILLPKPVHKEWIDIIKNNIITVTDDYVVLSSMQPVKVYADSVSAQLNPSVVESDITAAEQMRVLSNIAHYCVENDIGVLTFINDLFSDNTGDVNSFLNEIKSSWSNYTSKL